MTPSLDSSIAIPNSMPLFRARLRLQLQDAPQALAGVIDEMKTGKSTDHSSFKVANVLKILKQDLVFVKDFQNLSAAGVFDSVRNSDFPRPENHSTEITVRPFFFLLPHLFQPLGGSNPIQVTNNLILRLFFITTFSRCDRRGLGS